MITCSLDWPERREELQKKISSLPYNQALRQMLKTIDNMVRDLSRAEVNARRLNKEISTMTELHTVNAAIENLEQWLVMGALIR